RLIIVTGSCAIEQMLCGIPQFVRRGSAQQTPENTFHISIEHGDRLVESDAGDGGGGISADTLQFAQSCGSLRECASVLPCNQPRRSVQIARAMVIAEAAPFGKNSR